MSTKGLSLRERRAAFWSGPGGGAEVWRMAYPLILSQMSLTVQMFVDRVFLTWHSADAVAGAVTAGFFCFVVIGLFTATGEYATTFVAQYFGAGRPQRIGSVMWQGAYFSLAAGVVVAACRPLLGPLFRYASHPPGVFDAEIAYGGTLLLGGAPVILMATLASFFSGRGVTLVVLIVNIVVTLVNVVLDYGLIFGRLGFPALGPRGAALATVASQIVGALIYASMILRRSNRDRFGTASGWAFDGALFGRLLRYGLPSGIQAFVEILAFSIFVLLVGSMGTTALAATTIAFSLNGIVFFPMLGLGLGLSSLVGRYVGAGDPARAQRSAWSALALSMAYMSACGVAYLLFPGVLLAPFRAGADPGSFAPIAAIATALLRFVAVYSIFDMMNVIFAAALKGAGDTRYPLVLTFVLSCAALLAPSYLICIVFRWSIYWAWTAASAYVILLGLLMLRRFRTGKWRRMRVIEGAPPDLAPAAAEAIR